MLIPPDGRSVEVQAGLEVQSDAMREGDASARRLNDIRDGWEVATTVRIHRGRGAIVVALHDLMHAFRQR